MIEDLLGGLGHGLRLGRFGRAGMAGTSIGPRQATCLASVATLKRMTVTPTTFITPV
jgi:hypothetical protein